MCLTAAVLIALPVDRNPWLPVVSFAAIFCGGFAALSLLTAKLRTLQRTMRDFHENRFREPILYAPSFSRDEIDSIGEIYNAMAKRIDEQKKELREGDALRRDLIANVSHDLRTPLASLRGYVETLLVKDGSLSPEERRNYLEIAARQSERLGGLVSELFELAKLEYYDFKINAEPLLLSELAQDVLQKFELAAKEKDIALALDAPAKLPLVKADIGLIERALENLIGNALKFSPALGEVRIVIIQRTSEIEIAVKDSGSGIPEHDLPFIFDRFYRVDKSRRGGSSGAGLGLAITKRIVELHGGEIKVSNSASPGACFSFALPRMDAL